MRSLGKTGAPTPFVLALIMERFKDMSLVFQVVMASRVLTSPGSSGRAKASGPVTVEEETGAD